MLVPISASLQLDSPGGLSWRSTLDRTVSLADPADPLSLESIEDKLVANGKVFAREFLRAEKLLSQTTPEGRHASARIDDLGRVTETARGDLAPTRFSYDQRGRLTSIRRGTGERERRVSLSYDSLGRLEHVTDPLGKATRYGYDEADRLTKVTLRDGNDVAFDLDANGRVASLTPPGKPAHEFGYTKNDQFSSYEPPGLEPSASAGQARFNLDGQLDSVSLPGGEVVALEYDDAGRLATFRLPTGPFSHTYDPDTGRLSTVSSPYGVELAYGYDGFVLQTTSWSGVVSGTVEQIRNQDLLVASRSVNGDTVTFSYDDDGLLIRAGELSIERRPDVGLITGTTLGSVATTQDYDELGELSGFEAFFDGATDLSLAYERDLRGRITRLTESQSGQAIDREYRYDDRGRLVEVLEGGAQVAAYTWDANGNRTTATDSSSHVVSAVYDDQDRLLFYGDASYEYSANGELQTRTENGQTISYSYDVLGNLLSVGLPDGVLIEYVHDARGRRVAKKVEGILVGGLLYQDRLNPIAELDGGGNVVSRFVYGTYSTVPDYMVRDGVTYRIVADHLGSPRLIVGVETGAVIQELRYDAFGKALLDTNPGFQPFGFAGGLYDHQTGLVRFGLRDYDPEVGRWTTKDPIGFAAGDTNLYGYVLGDPVNFVDPNGLAADILFDAGFIVYDVYTLVDNLLGPCPGDALGEDLLALGADVLGAVIPFATGLGEAVRHGDALAAGLGAVVGGRRLPLKDADRLTELDRTLDRIESGGPFPYAKDGTTFRNREGRLPDGDYREYTVDTPGSSNRGTRRVVTDDGTDSFYYSDDHYGSFVQIDPTRR